MGAIYGDNKGGGRWGHNRGALGEEASRDESSRIGISRQGVHIPLSCPHCSSVFYADPAEAAAISRQDPDDIRAESILITWDEVKAMVEGKINNPRLRRTPTGYLLVELCGVCATHYEKRGLDINPGGKPPPMAKMALMRRDEVSAKRPLDISSLMKWLQQGRAAGLVR